MQIKYTHVADVNDVFKNVRNYLIGFRERTNLTRELENLIECFNRVNIKHPRNLQKIAWIKEDLGELFDLLSEVEELLKAHESLQTTESAVPAAVAVSKQDPEPTETDEKYRQLNNSLQQLGNITDTFKKIKEIQQND